MARCGSAIAKRSRAPRCRAPTSRTAHQLALPREMGFPQHPVIEFDFPARSNMKEGRALRLRPTIPPDSMTMPASVLPFSPQWDCHQSVGVSMPTSISTAFPIRIPGRERSRTPAGTNNSTRARCCSLVRYSQTQIRNRRKTMTGSHSRPICRTLSLPAKFSSPTPRTPTRAQVVSIRRPAPNSTPSTRPAAGRVRARGNSAAPTFRGPNRPLAEARAQSMVHSSSRAFRHRLG